MVSGIIKLFSACNTMVQDTEDIFTLRNYGKMVNCSITTLFPAAVRIAALSVGVVSKNGRGLEMETGTLHKVNLVCIEFQHNYKNKLKSIQSKKKILPKLPV